MGGVEWIGSKIQCSNPALENLWCDFYESFSYKGERFNVGEFAIVPSYDDSTKTRIGRLMSVYYSYEKWHMDAPFRAYVRWYSWAEDLDSKLNIHQIKFDAKDEVVEDMRSSNKFISLEDIQMKCHVVFGMEDEPIHQVKSGSVDTDLHFFCRYKIECDQIIPYFSPDDNQELHPENDKLPYTKLTTGSESSLTTSYASPRKLVEASPITKAKPIKMSSTKLSKYKRKPTHMDSPIFISDSEGSDVEEQCVDKIQSLSNPLKNVRLTPISKDKRLNESFSSPASRNVSVKRVLNDSFGNISFSPSGTSVFTYAVVNQDCDDKNRIKMKCKVTGQSKNDLKVFPTKLDKNVVKIKSPVKVKDLQQIGNRVELSLSRKAQKDASPNIGRNSLCSEPQLGNESSLTPSLQKSKRISGKSPNALCFSPYGTPSKVSSRRRSSKIVERNSYADFMSPEENISKKQVLEIIKDDDNLMTARTPLRRDIAKIDKLKKIDENEDLSSNVSGKLFKGDELGNVQPTILSCTANITHFISDEDNSSNDEQSLATPRKAKPCEKYISNENSTNYTHREKHNQSCVKTYIANEGSSTVHRDVDCSTSRFKRNIACPKRYVNDNVDNTDKQPTTPARSLSSKKHINDKNLTPGSKGIVDCPKKNFIKEKHESDDESDNSFINKDVSNTPKLITRSNILKDDNASSDNNTKNNSRYDSNESFVDAQLSRPKLSVSRLSKYVVSDESDDSTENLKTRRNILKNNVENKNFSKKNGSSPIKQIIDLAATSPFTPKNNKFDLRKSILISNTLKKLTYLNSDEDEKQPKTPGRRSRASTPKSSTKNTPSTIAKMVREGMITSSVQSRQKAIVKNNTSLSKARTKLHVSYVPRALPCREKEFADIINFLKGKLLDGCGGCMYVSGVPGTGKTATVTEIIRILQESAESGDVPVFKYININGMKLSEPRQSYVEIVKQLVGKTIPWEQAQVMLENKFVKLQKKSEPIILVVDELDILCTKRQDVVYNLLDWSTKAHAQLIVLAIANTMDLPERLLMGRVTSRLGLTRLTFQAYTHKQLQEIVTKRLSGINAFNPDAIQLVARKVASVSGDARRALDICRRAAEIAELEEKNTLVSMTHVNKALHAMITQPKVQAIKRCSRLEKLILQAIVAEVERTGVEETIFTSVMAMLVSLAALDGFQMVSNTIAMAAVAKLSACRLLLTDQRCNNIHQRIILNVSADDVYYAVTTSDI